MKTKATLTVPEASELLGISRNQGYALASRDGALGGVPVIRCGQRLVIPRAPLEQLLGIATAGENTTHDDSPASL